MTIKSRKVQVFHKPEDYEAFLALIAEATLRIPIRLLAYRIMPNHFHLVLWPHGAGDLSRWRNVPLGLSLFG